VNEQDTPYSIAPSAIHGMGLFATRDIGIDEIIGHVVGIPSGDDGPHVLWLEEAGTGVLVTNAMRFINHADEPSACYYDDLTVVALRNIAAGEEITHDYGAGWCEAAAAFGDEAFTVTA